MPELSGIDCRISIGGAPVAMIGDPALADGNNKIYTVSLANHRVFSLKAAVVVHKKQASNLTATTGTTTTTIKATAHGLVTGDLIVNTSRSQAARIVTRDDANTLTVASISGQTVGDTIEPYKIETPGTYSVSSIKGQIIYTTGVVRTIRVTTDFIPLTTAAFAHKASHNRESGISEVTPFGATHKKRMAGLKAASGTLSQFNIADATYTDALIAGEPVVIEYNEDWSGGGEPTRFWAHLESSEVEAAIEDVQDNTVSWISHDEWLRLGV